MRNPHELSIDLLKIDGSFIRDISTDPDDAGIISAILAMAGAFKLKVVAKRVETPEQLRFLRGRKCDIARGHLFGRPYPDAEPGTFLANRRTAAVPYQNELSRA